MSLLERISRTAHVLRFRVREPPKFFETKNPRPSGDLQTAKELELFLVLVRKHSTFAEVVVVDASLQSDPAHVLVCTCLSRRLTAHLFKQKTDIFAILWYLCSSSWMRRENSKCVLTLLSFHRNDCRHFCSSRIGPGSLLRVHTNFLQVSTLMLVY